MCSPFVYAAQPDTFLIEVDPATFSMNQSVDVIVTAIDSNGQKVTTYTNTVIIDLDGFVDPDLYEVPSNGLYTFSAEDQWQKRFSQGLKIKENGTYTLKVFDISDETIQGMQTLIVGQWSADVTTTWIVEIISPMSGETVTTPSINLMGRADMVRTPVQIFLSGMQITQETETDANGNFTAFISDIESGANVLQVKLVNLDGTIVAQSDPIPFVYSPPPSDGLFKGIDISPDNTVSAGDKVQFSVTVGAGVRNVEIKVGTLGVYPLDKQADGTYSKEITVDTVGTHPVSVTLIMEGWERKSYPDRDSLLVKEWLKIQNLKVVRESLDSSKADVQRDALGSASSYKVMYGAQKDSLTSSKETSGKSLTLTDLEAGTTYYFQVVGLDGSGATIGEPSSVVSAQVHGSAGNGSCTVWGITLTTTKIGTQYYLTWGAVPSATKYIIYKSDSAVGSVTSMQKVTETTDTKFAYPFDPSTTQNIYAYYAVEAVCSDGATAQIEGAKKVRVWPVSDILLILSVTLLLYAGYRLWKYT